jgi:hypothetical protein
MKPSSERLKRTNPEQDGPIRNPVAPRANPEARPPRDPLSAANAVVFGALESGVRTAYAVIDEYMRRGQDAARDTINDPTRRGFMSDDKTNFPGGYNAPGYNPWGSMSMFTDQWMAAMRAWSQAWSAFVPPGGWPMAGMNPFAPAAGQTPSVTVKIQSASPVEVTANLHPGTDSATLVSEPLRADGFTAPPINAPEIAREPGAVRVTVKVGARQPKGRYRSVIRRKADESVAGDLTVVIS